MMQELTPRSPFLVTPAEQKLLLRLRQLVAGAYFAQLTIGNDGIAELVLMSEKPGRKERFSAF